MFFLILAIFLLILVWQCGRIQMIMCDRINLARSGENILSFVLHPKKNTTAWTWKKVFCRQGGYFVNNRMLGADCAHKANSGKTACGWRHETALSDIFQHSFVKFCEKTVTSRILGTSIIITVLPGLGRQIG